MDTPRGEQRSIRLLTPLLGALALAACGAEPPARGFSRPSSAGPGDAGADTPRAAVLPGVDVLVESVPAELRGARVGLITNHTGRTAAGRSTIDALHEHPDLELVALFAPEHGLRGDVALDSLVASGLDASTGLPVRTLYGGPDRRKPAPAMLRGLDALLFDIQDVGARPYTYVWTMALAMEAAGEAGVRFVVLDRPNPIGGEAVQGPIQDERHLSFVGLHPVPQRHGLTPGELARFLVGERGVSVDLSVIPARGWRRDRWFDETGLEWRPPSPNMPSLESAAHYPGTVLLEGTNLSVGRGTDAAFQQVGAPWLDAEAYAARVRAAGPPGVRVDAVSFVPDAPQDGKYGGETVHGARLTVTGRAAYDPVRAGTALIVAARALAPDSFAWTGTIDRLAGTDSFRAGVDAGLGVERLTAGWDAADAAFRSARAPYLLYAGASSDLPTSARLEPLRARLVERVARAPRALYALALIDLADGATLGLDADEVVHAASTMKVPVLIELARQAERGGLSLDDSVRIRTTFRSIVDGGAYELDPADDSETELYALAGQAMSRRELARRMIVRSSNLATNLLVELVTADSVRSTQARIGADDMRVLRGVEDIPAYERGLNNTTTAAAFARTLEALARCRTGDGAALLSEAGCRDLIDILLAQEHDEMIPAGLPEGTPVAHKEGMIAGILHDGGIVYPPGREPYVLVILTRGEPDPAVAAVVAADLSRAVWRELTGTRSR
jgi:uncharacterized protein YbbC (DUF1343 family)